MWITTLLLAQRDPREERRNEQKGGMDTSQSSLPDVQKFHD